MPYQINDSRLKRYFIIGCQLTGTSFLTKALIDQGILMVHRTNWCYEDDRVIRWNDDILKKAGGTYLNPPKYEDVQNLRDDLYIKQRINLIFNLLNTDDLFMGIKDPRFSYTLPLLIPLFPKDWDVYLIFPTRNIKDIIYSQIYRRMDQKKKSFTKNTLENEISFIMQYHQAAIRTYSFFINYTNTITLEEVNNFYSDFNE